MNIENNIPGWMHPLEMEIISYWAKSLPSNGRILEIGSLFGRSTEVWRRFSDPSVEVYCVDLFLENYIANHVVESDSLSYPIPVKEKNYNVLEEFQKNVKDFKNFKFIQANLPRQINLYDNMPVDMLFIDAGHTNPNDWDIIKSLAKFLKKGGMITGHDYLEVYPDIIENAKKLSTIYETNIELYEGTSLWSVKVTKNYDEKFFI
jgi:predicted O-methyltransferase YrrM